MSEFGTPFPRGVRKLLSMQTLDEARWMAVENRDETSLGIFFYGVASTGIYCRPGCGARRPLRRNVTFFATPEDAAAAGFRACKRCRPDQEGATDEMMAVVAQVCRTMGQPGRAPSLKEIARDVGYSERHLRRRFQEVVGVSPATYARAQRSAHAREALRSSATVTEAVLDAGYGSFRAFYDHGASTIGMSPDRFRRGGLGEEIRYTSVQTPRGVVVIACTARGVCDVRIGRDEDELISEMRALFPRAIVQRDDEGLLRVAEAVAGGADGHQTVAQLPLDVQGTVFQIRVWEALRRIPSGETRSYAQIAQEIGAPSSIRAVASACAANRTALLIPCHRVRRSDGSLGGYRWGVETKAALLRAEARVAQSEVSPSEDASPQ